MNFELWFSQKHPDISNASALAVLELSAEGSTVPFIARYRKEKTGNIDEVKIQAILDSKETWDKIQQRQTFIVGEIEKQGKLTDELKAKVLGTFQLELLEDVYLPYKIKRKTKAQAAREAGLEPLAHWIWNCGHGTESPQEGQTLELWAFTFRNDEKNITDAATAIAGAQDILVERISETQELRQLVRSTYFEKGCMRTSKGDKPKPNSKFENYFNFFESIETLLNPLNSHRYLAARRGWIEEELKLDLGGKPDTDGTDGGFEAYLLSAFESTACTQEDSPGSAILKKAARLALKAHVIPAIENEVHKALREIADTAAITVFAENVRKLLLAAPFGSKAVLGVDPGIRTGCKLAAVSDSGKFIAHTVMHLQGATEKEHAAKMLPILVKEGNIRAIAVGNGTAGRETETFVRKTLKEAGITEVPVVMVSESGASVYSASEVAREEFPDLDLTVRGAISIARRLQDPLAELVKVDPKSIGVGQYQHDVSEHALKKSLDLVVDSCVNQVGVNLNTASYHLLAHVAGIGPGLAKSVVEYRQKHGVIQSRKNLLDIPRFSQKTFEQAAGFLRVAESENPLDNTGIHPERYAVLEARAAALGVSVKELIGEGAKKLKTDSTFKAEVGAYTFDDILKELEKPGRDPREGFMPFSYRDDIFELKDLKQGMVCPGIVTNVTNFGAFVDIGVHQDGLVHLSQLADRFVKDPREVVSPGDRVQVRVLEIHLEKNQIALTMRNSEAKAATHASTDGQRDSHRDTRRDTRNDRSDRSDRNERNDRGNSRPQRPDPRQNPRGREHEREKSNNSGYSRNTQDNRSSRPAPKPMPPKSPFNNAFAGLAALKSNLKK